MSETIERLATHGRCVNMMSSTTRAGYAADHRTSNRVNKHRTYDMLYNQRARTDLLQMVLQHVEVVADDTDVHVTIRQHARDLIVAMRVHALRYAVAVAGADFVFSMAVYALLLPPCALRNAE